MTQLTPRMERIVAGAEAQAAELGHDYVGTEHMLLALLADERGVATQVVSEFASPRAIRPRVIEVVTSAPYTKTQPTSGT